MKYCINCGEKILEEASCCVKCGCFQKEYTYKNIKYCHCCGSKIKNKFNKADNLCPDCGANVSPKINPMIKIARAFMLVDIISWIIGTFVGFIAMVSYSQGEGPAMFFACLLSLCWRIPMMLSLKTQAYNGGEITNAFKVCVLIFCNIVSGILLFSISNKYFKY